MSQIKSKERIIKHGEVFTSEREVVAMLDLVKDETERIDSRFLEPACGNGNFLAEVLRRKLAVVSNRYKKSQIEYERNAFIAIGSIYGLDIQNDNIIECRKRLSTIFEFEYRSLFQKTYKEKMLSSVQYVLEKNILCGDALDFTHPISKEAVVFSEWSMVHGNFIKRSEYSFMSLVNKPHQYSLSGDEGQQANIHEPLKEFPVQHFLEIEDQEEEKL